MKYLLTGGGTGGHVYPALALADEIRRHRPDAEFLYIGLAKKLESWVVPGRGYPIQFVHSRPCPRSSSPWSWLAFSLALGLGVVKAVFLVLRFRPQVIIGTGGYASAPALFAHGFLGKLGLSRAKVFIYEPNAFPGMLNQVVGRLADRIGLAFEQAARWFDMRRVAVVGYPVRRELLNLDRRASRERLGIAADKQVVLVFGGSGGARAINEAVTDALPLLQDRSDLLILHITGRYAGPDYNAPRDTERRIVQLRLEGDISGWYWRFDYMEEIQDAYAAADLVVCRGGASTLTEICICGLPALIVPLATASEDHQALNARELERSGAARVIYQEAFWSDGGVRSGVDGRRLAGEILEILDAPQKRRAMAAAASSVPLKNSLQLMLGEIERMVQGRRTSSLSLEFPLPSNELPGDPNALLGWVRQRIEEAGSIDNLEHEEWVYWCYQADRLLVDDGWYEIPLGRRNVGIKLTGLLKYQKRLPLLLKILRDRRRAGVLQRLFGGDFIHGGILRRNAIEFGVGMLGAGDDEVEEALLESLKNDPYFEVRAAAAKALGQLFDTGEPIEAALLKALGDRSPGVVIQAIRALGRIGTRPGILGHLERFYLHGNWQFRQEVTTALKLLVQRGVLTPDEVMAAADQILVSSPYFEPGFPLAENLRELVGFIDRAAADKSGGRKALER